MTDTSQKITARLQALYSGIQGWQRLEMGGGMFDDAKHMVIAGIRSKKTGLAAKDLKKLLFLRIFGNDFPKHKIERILSHLDGGSRPSGNIGKPQSLPNGEGMARRP